MAAAAGAPPAPAPHNPNGTRDDGIGYRSRFDATGREYIIPDDHAAALLRHLLSPEGWLYVVDGATINADPEKEDPVFVYKLNPIRVQARGGDPAVTYWDFEVHRGKVQVDSSGGTESYFPPPMDRVDTSGGTGATGSGKNVQQRLEDHSSRFLELERQLQDLVARGPRITLTISNLKDARKNMIGERDKERMGGQHHLGPLIVDLNGRIRQIEADIIRNEQAFEQNLVMIRRTRELLHDEQEAAEVTRQELLNTNTGAPRELPDGSGKPHLRDVKKAESDFLAKKTNKSDPVAKRLDEKWLFKLKKAITEQRRAHRLVEELRKKIEERDKKIEERKSKKAAAAEAAAHAASDAALAGAAARMGMGKGKKKGMGVGGKHRRLRGKGPFDFLDPAKNGLNDSIRHTGEVLGNAFDPNKNGLAAAVNAAGDKLKAVDWNAVKNKIGDGLDPAKNGVSDAFNKFGGDAQRAFEDLGNKIKDSAQRDKAKLDQAFAPLVHEFTNPDSALAKFVQSAGIPISADDWKKKFEDPDTYFTILSVLVTAAASVCSAGLAGPGVFAATQALIAGTKLLTKAAMGKPIDPMDIAGVVTSVVPGAGGGTATTWLKVATSAASKVATSAVKEAAKNVIKSNKDGLIQMGQTLATLSSAATTPASPPAQNTDNDVEEAGEPGEGGDEELPPAAGGDVELPPAAGGDVELPAAADDTPAPEEQAADGAAQAAESAPESQAAAQATEASDVGNVSLEPPPPSTAPTAAPTAAPPQVQIPAYLLAANHQPVSQYGQYGSLAGGSKIIGYVAGKHPFYHIKRRAFLMGRRARIDTLDPFFFEGTVNGRLAGSGKRSREEDEFTETEPTEAEIAAADARVDRTARVARSDSHFSSIEQRLNALSQEMFGKPAKDLDDDENEELDRNALSLKMFGKPADALNDDENEELDRALRRQNGDESEEDSDEVIMKRKPTAKQTRRASKFMRRLKAPARKAAAYHQYMSTEFPRKKREYNKMLQERRAAPGYSVPSDEDDTEFELDSESESSSGEEAPRRLDYSKFFLTAEAKAALARKRK
jgi:hypothetical protein